MIRIARSMRLPSPSDLARPDIRKHHVNTGYHDPSELRVRCPWMPQADLLFSRAEHEALVQFVFEQEACLVPSHLPTSTLIEIMDAESYRTYIDKGERLFHIQRRDFTRAPLEIRRVRSADGREVFYVAQRSGGPTVDLLGPFQSEEGSQLRIADGFISHHPTFWNPLTHSNEKAPPAQKAFYNLLLKYIRAHAVRTKAGKRTYWVGLSTAVGLKNGTIALPDSWVIKLEIPTFL